MLAGRLRRTSRPPKSSQQRGPHCPIPSRSIRQRGGPRKTDLRIDAAVGLIAAAGRAMADDGSAAGLTASSPGRCAWTSVADDLQCQRGADAISQSIWRARPTLSPMSSANTAPRPSGAPDSAIFRIDGLNPTLREWRGFAASQSAISSAGACHCDLSYAGSHHGAIVDQSRDSARSSDPGAQQRGTAHRGLTLGEQPSAYAGDRPHRGQSP